MKEQDLKKRGLFKKYVIRKANRKPVDERAEYFVLRLDSFGSDTKHIEACRKAILVYADNIAFHMPELANDIYAKWGDPYNQFNPQGLDYLRRVIKEHESVLHYSYGGDEATRIQHVLSHYQRKAAEGTAGRKELMEKVALQFLAFKMVAEMIGMGDTHAEKAARLRGFIQLLDSTITKLRDERVSDIESNWPFFSFGERSDYPYREILRKFDDLKRTNEELKRQLENKQSIPEA